METLKAGVEIASACLTPVIAVLVVHIAWQQHKTSRDNLRLALYEKRFRVYAGLNDLITAVIREADVSLEDLRKLDAATNERVFLFGNDIDKYIQEVRKKAVRLRHVNKQLHYGDLPVGDRRNQLAEEDQGLLHWFTEQLSNSGEKFREYLYFETQL